jgi:hypothetical protein
MQHVRRRILRGAIAFASCLAGLAAVASAPAVAGPPDHGTFIIPDEGTDPAGSTCAFPVRFSQVERGDFRIFSDSAGNFIKALIHIDYDATISANGKTIVERDTFTRTLYGDDTMRDTGLTVHIQGPGGNVLRDAGQIVYSDTNENVAYVHGPHPQLFGASFCEALTP